MFRISLVLLSALFVAGCVGTNAPEPVMPAPPPGYSWQNLKQHKAYVLMPDSWHFKKHGSKKRCIYTFSKEDIDAEGSFETGLTYTVWLKLGTKPQGRVKPSGFARALLGQTNQVYKFEKCDIAQQGPFQAFRYQYVDTRPGLKPIRIYNLLMANDRTGTLHMFVFEAPTAEWDAAWKTGESIMSKLGIDDQI